jgi:uncharacterized protein YndB with AHSA1/START domain
MPDTLEKTSNSFTMSRVFDAPRDRVFKAWTDPQILKQWWSPPGYTTPDVQIDLRQGGGYRVSMKPIGGDAMNLSGKYLEVKKPEKLVYTWAWTEDDGPGHESKITVQFRALGDKTEVSILHELFAGEESRDKHIHGWTGCLDKLAHTLGGHEIRMSVDVKAPAAKVFKALTADRELERWWPTTAKSDLRPGGKYVYDFQFEDASKSLDQDGEFIEVVPDRRVRYTWPATSKDYLTEVTFELSERSGDTEVRLIHTGFGSGGEWDESLEGHKSGWGAFIANLKSVLEGGADNRKSVMGMKTKT